MGSKSGGKAINEGVRDLYIEWMKLPKEARIAQSNVDKSYPLTKEAFSKKYHVNKATLWRWEQSPDFKRELANEGIGLLSADEITKMISVMKAKALDGNVQAFNALMKIAGLNNENAALFSTTEQEAARMSQLSDNELTELANSEEWDWDEV